MCLLGRSFSRADQGSIREYVYQSLKSKILNLQLPPGTKISEKDISEEYNVSRTPVREVFIKLAQEDLLDIYPQRGSFISLIDMEHVEEARFIREHLEKAVVREACEKLSEKDLFYLESNIAGQEICCEKQNYLHMQELDEEFHQIIYTGSGKIQTWSIVQQMNNHFYRLRMLRLAHSPFWDTILTQHKQILQAIKAQDPDQAEKITEEHLRLIILEKEQIREKYLEYFR